MEQQCILNIFFSVQSFKNQGKKLDKTSPYCPCISWNDIVTGRYSKVDYAHQQLFHWARFQCSKYKFRIFPRCCLYKRRKAVTWLVLEWALSVTNRSSMHSRLWERGFCTKCFSLSSERVEHCSSAQWNYAKSQALDFSKPNA